MAHLFGEESDAGESGHLSFQQGLASGAPLDTELDSSKNKTCYFWLGKNHLFRSAHYLITIKHILVSSLFWQL